MKSLKIVKHENSGKNGRDWLEEHAYSYMTREAFIKMMQKENHLWGAKRQGCNGVWEIFTAEHELVPSAHFYKGAKRKQIMLQRAVNSIKNVPSQYYIQSKST